MRVTRKTFEELVKKMKEIETHDINIALKEADKILKKDLNDDDWILNPFLLEASFHFFEQSFLMRDPFHAYRGVGNPEEIINVLTGKTKTGAFWSNFPDEGYVVAGLFITRNPDPDYLFKGEIRQHFRVEIKDLKAVYIRPSFFCPPEEVFVVTDIVRIYPPMEENEFYNYLSEDSYGINLEKAKEIDLYRKIYNKECIKKLAELARQAKKEEILVVL